MKETLASYLTERLKGLCRELGANWLRITLANGTTLAQAGTPREETMRQVLMTYGDEALGTLGFLGCARTPELEAAAGEIAALLKAPQPMLAIAFDRAMAKLKLEEPVCDWAGIYLLREKTLYLTAYRGAPTPHPIIHSSKGICGAAVSENRTLNIEDVTQDPRYLSCDIRARSELVVPIRDVQGKAIGEVDLDSHQLNAFHPKLVAKVEELAGEIARLMLN